MVTNQYYMTTCIYLITHYPPHLPIIMEWDNSLVTVDCCDVDRTQTSSINEHFPFVCVPSSPERVYCSPGTGEQSETFVNALIAVVNYSQTTKRIIKKKRRRN